MKTLRTDQTKTVRWLSTLVLFGAIITTILPAGVWAAATDTDAGDSISNRATINYSVGSVSQDAIDSNIAAFVVDHKVRPVAAWAGDDTAVPNATDQYLTFTVTNDGNTDSNASATLEIQLTAQQGANGSEDDFDVTASSIRIYVESNSTPGLQIPGDNLVTDYNAGTTGFIALARDTSATVYLVADMPGTATDGQTALCHLIATAWDSGTGIALAEDGDGDDPNVMEVVFADGTGSLPAGDVNFDGLNSAAATFTIEAAAVAVTKSSSVIADPFGSAYRVPGATVRYTVRITNAGAMDAQSLQVVDQIPAGTNYVVGSEGTVAGTIGTVTSVEYSSTDQAGLGSYSPVVGPGTADAAITWIRLSLSGSVNAGDAAGQQAYFDVVIE